MVHRKKGFTLVEIMTVLTIIAILFVVLLPRFGFATDKAKEAGVKQDFRAFQTSAESAINEFSFKKLDDGNIDSRLNEYLDKSMSFTNSVSLKENPWGYNYRLSLHKNSGDEGSGTLEFICIKGYGSSSAYAYADDGDTSTAFGTKLVITVSGGLVTSETVDFQNGDSSLIPGDKTPTGIYIAKTPKTNFYVGDTFTYSGLEVRVNQADGTTRATTNFTVTTPTMTVGTHTVTVKFTEDTRFTATYSISVVEKSSGGGGDNGGDNGGNGGDNGGDNGGNQPAVKTLTRIEISSPPSKVAYVEGEQLNTSGLVVNAYFSDGTSQNVTSSCSMNKNLIVGQTAVLVSYTYGGLTRQATITGLSVVSSSSGGDNEPQGKTLTSLILLSKPNKLSYIEGESFNITGLSIQAQYSDNTTANVTTECSYSSALSVGQTQVIFNYTYNGLTKSVIVSGITVTPKSSGGGGDDTQAKVLTSIQASGNPTLKYSAGQNFNTNGLVVTAFYSDGTKEEVTSFITHNGYNLQPATTKVDIFYTAGMVTKSTSISITVSKKLNSINVQHLPNKTTGYYVGENLITSGIQVVAYFSDGSTADITGQVTLSNHTSLTAGWTPVTVSYTFEGVTCTTNFQVHAEERTVPKEKELDSIFVDTLPKKVAYWENEVFDDAGIVVKANYDNGEVGVVTSHSYSNHTGLTAGTRTITVSFTYNGVTKTTQFDITVKVKPAAEFTRLSVIKPPTKTSYYVGEEFDPAGMVVQGYYPAELGLEPIVTTDYIIVEGTKKIEKDPHYVIIQHTRSDGTPISIQYAVRMAGELDHIEMTTPPNKTQYLIGEIFDPTGMEITAYFVDDTSLVVEPTAINTDPLKSGQTSVPVSYVHASGGDTIEVPVEVRPNIAKIEVEAPPTKLEYREGTNFDPTGIKVTATFEDDSTRDVSEDIVVVGGDNLTLGTTKVTLKFTWVDKTVTCEQEVKVIGTIVKSIFAGNQTSFFIDDKEDVYAFGLNTSGQLGMSLPSGNVCPFPRKIEGLTGVRQIIPSVTGNFTMFLMGDGTVYGAGDNSKGQLGVGNTSNKSAPTKVLLDGLCKKVVVGTNHTIYLMVDGSVYASGLNSSGQLGLEGTGTVRNKPERITSINDIVDVEAAGDHTLFITKSGRVYACGSNAFGQLGLNNLETQYSPYPIEDNQTGPIDQVYTSSTHTILHSTAGRFYATGDNSQYQLATGDNTARKVPTFLSNITSLNPKEIVLLPYSSIFTLEDNSIRAIGQNTGKFANGSSSNATSLTTGCTMDYLEIAYGLDHAIITDKLGHLFTSGTNSSSQLGQGDTTNRFAPHVVFSANNIEKVVCGTDQIWIKDDLGNVWSSGRNDHYQLGNGALGNIRYLSPNDQASLKAQFDNIDYVVTNHGSGSNYFANSLFVMKDNTIWATGDHSWKGNPYGGAASVITKSNYTGGKIKKIVQLDGVTALLTEDSALYKLGQYGQYCTLGNSNTNTFLQEGSGFLDFDIFDAGANSIDHGLRIKSNKTVWGSMRSTGNYQLGNDYTTTTFNYNTNMSSARQVLALYGASMILQEDGSVWSTGYNGYGTLGSGNTTLLTKFTKVVDSGSGVVKLVKGGNQLSSYSNDKYNSVYALHSDGTVSSVGQNNVGQLGIGSTNDSYFFTKIAGLTGVKDIYTGDKYVMFETDHGIYAAGQNSNGQLGVGDTTNKTNPTKVLIDHTQVESIHTYRDHTIFIMKDNRVMMCGNPANGAIGSFFTNVTVPSEMVQFRMAS